MVPEPSRLYVIFTELSGQGNPTFSMLMIDVYIKIHHHYFYSSAQYILSLAVRRTTFLLDNSPEVTNVKIILRFNLCKSANKQIHIFFLDIKHVFQV
jgi:hypothetical protein